jgi:hypothetical protein
VDVNGLTTLFDFCDGPSFASGGFISDSLFTGSTVINGAQQQYLVRNSNLDGWTNGVWNQVFAGVTGAPPQSFPNPPYTTLAATPVSREKPFLYVDGNSHFDVYVPEAQSDSSGTTWSTGQTPGRSLPIEDFFVVHPGDSVQTINNALSRGRNSSSHRASTTSTRRSRSSTRTPSCSGWACRRSRPRTASCR